MLALEDLHWADAETIEVVEYLADNIADEPLLCLATMRDDESTGAARALRQLSARRVVTMIPLNRFDAAPDRQAWRPDLPGPGLLARRRQSSTRRSRRDARTEP